MTRLAGAGRMYLPSVSHFILAWGLLIPARVAAQPSPDSRSDSVLMTFMTAHRLPSISVAVGGSEGVVYRRTLGFADMENRVPATPETLYKIASVTKPLTAAGILRLVDLGKLNLDAPIHDYCPAFPAKRWPVTARTLLAHTGGLRDYTRVVRGVWMVETVGGRQQGSSTIHVPSISDAVAVFAEDSLRSEPGTRHLYSNWGYVLLGCAIEGASGRSYSEFMAQEVFRPLGMTRTQPDDAYGIIENRARPYQMRTEATANYWWFTPTQKEVMEVGRLYNARFEDASHKLSAGGILSTPTDLVKFAQAVLHGNFLSASTRAEMMTEQATRGGESTGWGLGWSIGEGLVGLRGGQPGATAQLTTFSASGSTVAILTNRDLVPTSDLFRQLADIWAGSRPN